MNIALAEEWVREITALLTGKNLITVSVTAEHVDILQNQTFSKAYVVDYRDGTGSVALSDSYGVMTGAQKWSIDPDKRAIHAETTNAYSEKLRFAWVVVDEAGLWERMDEARARLYAFAMALSADVSA